MTNTTAFDVANYLETDEDIRAFLSTAAEDGSPEHLNYCLGIAVRARGMTQVANEVGVTRASLINHFQVMLIQSSKQSLSC